jgi:hypothetical protein
MVLSTGRIWLTSLLLLAAAAGAAGAEDAREEPAAEGGQVTLALKDYLVLRDTAERLDRRRAETALHREATASEVAVERVRVRIADASPRARAQVTEELEVMIQGRPKQPQPLPITGFPSRLEVVRGAGTAALSAGGEGPVLVAAAPGRYAVRAEGRMTLEASAGESRLAFTRIAAPVAELDVDLPAELGWSFQGAVPVEDKVDHGRRLLRLSAKRGETPRLTLRRQVDGNEAARLLAESTVLTIVQLRPDGPRRHDVVLYDVSRGALSDLAVELPAGLAVEQAASDEGMAVPEEEGRRLVVHRRRQLQGTGFLVLTSTPAPGTALPLDAVRPGPPVRARYLALASTVAAAAQPLPAARWERVDLEDLPPTLGEALTALDLAAAWRLIGAEPGAGAAAAAGVGTGAGAGDGTVAGAGTGDGAGTGTKGDAGTASSLSAGTSMAVSLLPPAGRLETLVRLRETTTLLTVDGTVLHRDRFTLGQAGAALDLSLPAGATLWSASVGAQAVRPLEHAGGLSVPLGFAARAGAALPVVEVVSVLERALPGGRSRLGLELAQVRSPVLAHRWQLLLPEGARYRFRAGDLQPVPPPAGRPAGNPVPKPPADVLTDRINVGGNESGRQSDYVVAESPVLDERRVATGATVQPKDLPAVPQALGETPGYFDFDSFAAAAQGLKKGLVGGVKPLPITIPLSGKSLLLSGALPPSRVAVELEVKGRR